MFYVTAIKCDCSVEPRLIMLVFVLHYTFKEGS